MTGATQSRLQIRAIVAARRAEDHRRDIDAALDELQQIKSDHDALLDELQHIGRALAVCVEALDRHGEAVEHLLALTCAASSPRHRERLTGIARTATQNGSSIAGSFTLLARTVEQMVGKDAP